MNCISLLSREITEDYYKRSKLLEILHTKSVSYGNVVITVMHSIYPATRGHCSQMNSSQKWMKLPIFVSVLSTFADNIGIHSSTRKV